jgi:hypothetical protein
MIWLHLLIHGISTITDLHYTIQIRIEAILAPEPHWHYPV